MGKTPASKRLRVLVFPPLDMWGEITELREKGHEIYTWGQSGSELFDAQEWDLVLGPKAWRMDEPLRKYLDTAVKEARAAKGSKK